MRGALSETDADLRAAIGSVDARMPGGPNCYRRALLEIALDPGRPRGAAAHGARRQRCSESGHAWLGGDGSGDRSYDAVISHLTEAQHCGVQSGQPQGHRADRRGRALTRLAKHQERARQARRRATRRRCSSTSATSASGLREPLASECDARATVRRRGDMTLAIGSEGPSTTRSRPSQEDRLVAGRDARAAASRRSTIASASPLTTARQLSGEARRQHQQILADQSSPARRANARAVVVLPAPLRPVKTVAAPSIATADACST